MMKQKSAVDILNQVKFWLPLVPNVVDVAVMDKPGVYVIKKNEEYIYVGRSIASVRRRLLQHCSRFPRHEFGVLYVDSSLLCMRYEYRLIEGLRRSSKLENGIAASISAM